jgi:hypothetical protein
LFGECVRERFVVHEQFDNTLTRRLDIKRPIVDNKIRVQVWFRFNARLKIIANQRVARELKVKFCRIALERTLGQTFRLNIGFIKINVKSRKWTRQVNAFDGVEQ